jgi:hypothetical protein
LDSAVIVVTFSPSGHSVDHDPLFEESVRFANASTGILIVGRRQLDRVVRAYIKHHNEHRPHPFARAAPTARQAATSRAAAAEPDRPP